MGSHRHSNGTPRHTQSPAREAEAAPTDAADAPDDGPGSGALDENVGAIKRWEQALLHERSPAERLSDRITGIAASGPVLAAHLVWFVVWIGLNVGWFGDVAPFDPFPFPFLTMTVSLEAIFLALFVLASQNRLARQADMRAHLNLQIDLLAEREMTAVLRLLQDLTAHLEVPTSVTPQQVHDLAKKTDLDFLTRQMDALVQAESTEEPAPEPAKAEDASTR